MTLLETHRNLSLYFPRCYGSTPWELHGVVATPCKLSLMKNEISYTWRGREKPGQETESLRKVVPSEESFQMEGLVSSPGAAGKAEETFHQPHLHPHPGEGPSSPSWTGFCKPSACLQACPRARHSFPGMLGEGRSTSTLKKRRKENRKCLRTKLSWWKQEGSEGLTLSKLQELLTVSKMNRRVNIFSTNTQGYNLDLLTQELPEG